MPSVQTHGSLPTSDSALLNRRRFLQLGAQGVGAGALAATGLHSSSVQAAGGPTILLVGSSSMHGALGKQLEIGLGEAGYQAKRHAKSSSGLARPDFYNWPKEGARLQNSLKPSATVLLFGGNDAQGIWLGKEKVPGKKRSKDKWIRWGEPGWDEEYRRRIAELSRILAPQGEAVVWVGMPVVEPTKLCKRVEHLNGLFKAEADQFPNGHYIDTWPLLANNQGKYTPTKKVNGKRRRVRAQDGVHLSPTGARLMTEFIVPKVQAILGVRRSL